MIFTIFGRGRSMFALVGAGITEENLLGDAKTVIGPCTCTVNELEAWGN